MPLANNIIIYNIGAENAILACGLGEQYVKYISKITVNDCEQLQFHEVPTTAAICRKLSDNRITEDLQTWLSKICTDESEYQYINQDYPARDFTIINKGLKKTFSIKVNETTKLWEIEIDCANPEYGNITCRRKEANLTIWVTSFGELKGIIIIFIVSFSGTRTRKSRVL